MKITVLVCTFNRCSDLPKTLQSIAASILPQSLEWEVLIVDNNSSDRTREVVGDFCRQYPGRFRYQFEPQAGKSYALNAGIREAKGDVIAFTDDDVTMEPDWLQNLTAGLHGAEWAGAGGRTVLAQRFSPPAWMATQGPYSMGGALAALFDLGEHPSALDRAPYGANMAFQRKMFEKYGAFRTDLGPSPSRKIPRPNEDTEFGRRLLAAGERLRYEPSAVVYHPVPGNRVQKDYFLTWWFDYGRALVREGKRRPDIWGIPRYYFTVPKVIATLLAPRAIGWIVTWHPQRRFFNKCSVWMTAGEIVEQYRRWGNDARPSSTARRETEKECSART